MSKTPRSAAWIVSAALLLGVASPGCDAVAAALYKIMVMIGKEVLKSAILKYVEMKLDEWVLPKKDTKSTGGDPLRSQYSGKVLVTVRDEATGNETKFELTNPTMKRASPESTDWHLDPDMIDYAKRRVREEIVEKRKSSQ